MKINDIVEFKRETNPFKSPASAILGGLLKLLEPEWSGWGWHLAVAISQEDDGWWILEARAKGVALNWYSNAFLIDCTLPHTWLGDVDYEKRDAFLREYLGQPYDIQEYFWTGLSYLFRHFFNRPIRYLLDNRWHCVELVFFYCREMGKPINSIHDCPLISDFEMAMNTKKFWELADDRIP